MTNKTSEQKVKEGTKIPSFTLPDQNGKMISIDSLIGQKNLIIYFYPKDETAGCTKEACSFRDSYEAFQEAGAEVIGISSDPVDSHKNFAQHHKLPFVLLSDNEGKVREKFNVPRNFLGLLPGRVTYVVDKSGTVMHMFNSQFNINGHINEALEVLNKIKD
ncbi:MAG: peroxiredoxin [Bacteroidales bacterium]|nr:peroxiredoxin [Bacteroidales bacterium]